jgi:hypothetical protein
MSELPTNPASEPTPAEQSPASDIPNFQQSFTTVQTPLRFETCLVCGVVFGLAMDVFLKRVAERGTIYCFNGHPLPAKDLKPDPGDMLQASIRLLNELRKSQSETNRLRELLAQYPPLAPRAVDEKELKRRLLWLWNHARLLDYGRRECRFCSRARQGRGLINHFKEEHQKEVIDLPREFFG